MVHRRRIMYLTGLITSETHRAGRTWTFSIRNGIGWSDTIKTLVMLFWLGNGASYRMVPWVFVIHCSTIHASSTESLRSRWPFATWSSTSQRPWKTWRQYPLGLQGWQDTQPSWEQLEQSTAAMSGSNHPAALIVLKEQLNVSFIYPAGFLWPTIRAASLTPTVCVLTKQCSAIQQVYSPPGHFILADGGYLCLQQPLPFISAYKRPEQGVGDQRANYHLSRARSIIERAFGRLKTISGAIFLQALEVHHIFVPHVITQQDFVEYWKKSELNRMISRGIISFSFFLPYYNFRS